jgi:signal peptidase II
MPHIKKKYVTIIIISSVVFLLDRFTKYLVLDLFENITITEIYINHFINLLLIWNDGIAFGLLNFSDQKIYSLITIIIFFVSIVVLIIALKSKTYDVYFFSMIFGGALGNLFDRVKYNAVPDFIDLHINNYHWFIFNVADIFISLGVICLIFDEIFLKRKLQKTNDN